MRREQQERISVLQQDLRDDKDKIALIGQKKAQLAAEVETLEKIRNVLPNWCRESPNENNG